MYFEAEGLVVIDGYKISINVASPLSLSLSDAGPVVSPAHTLLLPSFFRLPPPTRLFVFVPYSIVLLRSDKLPLESARGEVMVGYSVGSSSGLIRLYTGAVYPAKHLVSEQKLQQREEKK